MSIVFYGPKIVMRITDNNAILKGWHLSLFTKRHHEII